MRVRVLIDATENHISRYPTSGLGVRIAELAETLSLSFAVTIFSPGTSDPLHIGDSAIETDAGRWRGLVADTDIVMFFDVADRSRLDAAIASRARIVLETAPPIEHAGYPSMLKSDDPEGRYSDIVGNYVCALRVADHFVCRSEVERATVLSSLVTLGLVTVGDLSQWPDLEHLLTTVPIGYSRYSREQMDRCERAKLADVLWTGGIWSFYDPGVLIEAIALLTADGLDVTAAYLYGQPHPDNLEAVAALDRQINEHNLNGRVVIRRDQFGHYQRDGWIKGAAALICVARPGAENVTCVRLRIRDSKLYGVPVIVDGFGATASEVRRDGTGVVLENVNAQSLASAVRRCLSPDKAPVVARTERFQYPTDLYGLTSSLRRVISRPIRRVAGKV